MVDEEKRKLFRFLRYEMYSDGEILVLDRKGIILAKRYAKEDQELLPLTRVHEQRYMVVYYFDPNDKNVRSRRPIEGYSRCTLDLVTKSASEEEGSVLIRSHPAWSLEDKFLKHLEDHFEKRLAKYKKHH